MFRRPAKFILAGLLTNGIHAADFYASGPCAFDVAGLDCADTEQCEDGICVTNCMCDDIDECTGNPDICDPHATCSNNIGSYECTCNEGYFGFGEECSACGEDTDFETMTVNCGPERISIAGPYCSFWNDGILEQQFTEPGDNCLIENTGFAIEMSIPTTTECGTNVVNNSTHVVYSNAVMGEVPVSHEGILTKNKELNLEFECAFEIGQTDAFEKDISAIVETINIVRGREIAQYDVVMGVFTDESFTELIPDEYAIVVPDMIYAGVSLQNGADNLVMRNEKCWATPSADPNDSEQYVFIDDFCPQREHVLKVLKNGQDKSAQFQIESFTFVGHDEQAVYFHCHAVVCNTEIENCEMDCSSERKRRRRSTGPNKSALRVGPIRVIAPNL
jgi:hypothetical protein